MIKQHVLMDMRRALKEHGVTVACAKPMWVARDSQGNVLTVQEKMKDAIYFAFNQTLLRLLEELLSTPEPIN